MSRIVLAPVSGSLSKIVKRMMTFSGAAYVMPRSWHSATSYFKFSWTGSPHLLQNVTWFLFMVPHFGHMTVGSAWNGFVVMVAPQDLHVLRRWCRPLRLPHLHSQLPME